MRLTSGIARRRRQSGVALFIALIALVAMTLAGVALVRSMDTGLVIAGNLAFKQATTNVAERGTEQAIAWLQANMETMVGTSALVWNNDVANGYYASYMQDCDLTSNYTSDGDDGVNWKDADHPLGIHPSSNCGMGGMPVSVMPSDYSASYVINRMCSAEGKPGSSLGPGGTVSCAIYVGLEGLSKSTKRVGHPPDLPMAGQGGRYFRITTRVLGPRNTVSYVQTLVGL